MQTKITKQHNESNQHQNLRHQPSSENLNESSFIDHRNETVQQNKLMHMASTSPQAAKHHALETHMNNSAHNLAQRKLQNTMLANQNLNPEKNIPLQKKASTTTNESSNTIQRVTYSGVDYQKNKPGFVSKAKEDLQLDESTDNTEVLRTLDELKDHDVTTVIKDVEHLKSLIKLDHSAGETKFRDEIAILHPACENMKAPATKLSTFAGGEKSGPQKDVADLQLETKKLTNIPIQDQSLTGIDNALSALQNTLKVAKNPIGDKDKAIKPTKEAGTKTLAWANSFPATFMRSMRKWRIKASIGAEGTKGNYLAIGPKSDTLGPAWGAQDKRGGVIRADTWSPGINDTWLKSGIRTELPFQLTQIPSEEILSALKTGDVSALAEACKTHAEAQDDHNNSHYWDLRIDNFTRFGVELVELLKSGYRLEDHSD